RVASTKNTDHKTPQTPSARAPGGVRGPLGSRKSAFAWDKNTAEDGLFEPNVRQQAVYAAFAAEAAFLVAAKRARGVELVVSVCPDHPGAELRNDLENLAAFVGPDSGAEAVRRVVGAFDGFVRRAESHDTENRPEDLLLGDAVAGSHAG